VGLTAFSNADLNRALYLVKFSEKIPGRFVENQQMTLENPLLLVKVIQQINVIYKVYNIVDTLSKKPP